MSVEYIKRENIEIKSVTDKNLLTLAVSTTKLLSFKGAEEQSKIIENETNKDLSTIVLEGNEVISKNAIRSAEVVAETICSTKLESLENHSLRA